MSDLIFIIHLMYCYFRERKVERERERVTKCSHYNLHWVSAITHVASTFSFDNTESLKWLKIFTYFHVCDILR